MLGWRDKRSLQRRGNKLSKDNNDPRPHLTRCDRYAASGDVIKDYTSVVGYAGFIIQ